MSIPNNLTVSVWLGKVVQAKCQAIGNPVPNITWYKEDGIVSTTTDLIINITSEKQIGIYRCVAANIRGSTSRDVLFKRTSKKYFFIPGNFYHDMVFTI